MGCGQAWRQRRDWKKAYLGVGASGETITQVLTDSIVDAGTTGVTMLNNVSRSIPSVTADGAIDIWSIYEVAEARGAEVLSRLLEKRVRVGVVGDAQHVTERSGESRRSDGGNGRRSPGTIARAGSRIRSIGSRR